jgi:Holliday junction resolvase RusA-like endonuclease
MTVVAFTVFGDARPAGSKTIARAGDKTWIRESRKGSGPWRKAVAQVAGEAMDGSGLLEGPLFASFTFYRVRPLGHFGTGRNAGTVKVSAPFSPTTKPDLLKTARAIEDALTGVVYRDDAQIVVERLEKRYGEPARVEVSIEELEERP